MKWLTRAPLMAFLLIIIPNGLAAEEEAPLPCSAPEFRQFDFWLGEWDLTWADSGRGTNIITAELGSCVIEENFSTIGDQPFQGNSLSSYNPATGMWSQTWVDNSGAYLDFTGAYKDSAMILSRSTTDKDGKRYMQRMVWFNIAENSLDWHWERSDDAGKTWNTLWAIDYTRRAGTE